MTNYQPSDEVRRIRAQLDHPVIDSDGHLIEFLPLVRDLLVDLAGESVAQRFDAVVHSGETLQGVSDEMRKRHGIAQSPWWGIPTRNTLDRATAMLPRCSTNVWMSLASTSPCSTQPTASSHPSPRGRVASGYGGRVQRLPG